MSDGQVRRMRQEDVAQVVDIHKRAFRGFFLTFLGLAFLRELYSAILADDSGIAYVYEVKGAMVGFVAGSSQPAGLYRRLLRQRWLRFAWVSLPAVLRSPGILPRLLRAFQKTSENHTEEARGELMSIAILPEEQGQGIGKALVGVFVEEAGRRRVGQVALTTDRLDNDATNRFYQGLGFRCTRSFSTPEGRQMNEYVMIL